MFVADHSDPFDLIREGLARLAAEDRSAWSPAARSDRLLELQELVERVDAEAIRCAAAWDAVAAWAEDSVLGPRSWLASRASMTDPAANRLLRSARLLRDHDHTAEALAAGDITVAHVHALATAAHERAGAFTEHETTLVAAARAVEPRDFTTVTRRWRELADDEHSRRDAAFAFERRGLHVSPTTGGSVLSGFLDPEASAIVTAALDALEPPDPTADHDRRSLAQRRADALVLVCERSLAGTLPDTRPLNGVDILVDYETLAGRPDTARTTTGLSSLRCDIAGFGPVARITAERLACDCALGRVVMQGRSQILDYGRRTRTVPRGLQRMIRLRDQHCQWPGCRAQASWCDVHHLVHWLHGGTTSEGNLALLCRHHHVACHERGWKLARGPGGLALAA